MKLLLFDDYKLGVLKGNDVVDVSDVVKDIPQLQPQDMMKGLIEQWDSYKGKIESAVASGSGKPLSSVKVRPPLPKPETVACMAVNYLENHTMPEPAPINAFLKTANCVIGDGDTMVLPDTPATVFEGEAELAVIIGKRAENVSRDDAMSYVFGYTNFIDGSARGFPPFYLMKARATFAPIGPFIVTADEVKDPHNLSVKLWNNGTLMQDFNTDDMGNDIPRCIEFISSTHPLDAGDVLATGTNHRGLHPFMDGDKVELEVEGMGRLHINISDALKRKWKRETRLDRLEAAKARGEQTGFVGSITPQLEGKYTPAEVKA